MAQNCYCVEKVINVRKSLANIHSVAEIVQVISQHTTGGFERVHYDKSH